MSALLEIYLSKEKIKSLLAIVENNDLKGIGVTMSINDESDKYGQNVSAYISQTKEERDSQKPRSYVGNGKVFFVKGNITIAKRHPEAQTSSGEDLPY